MTLFQVRSPGEDSAFGIGHRNGENSAMSISHFTRLALPLGAGCRHSLVALLAASGLALPGWVTAASPGPAVTGGAKTSAPAGGYKVASDLQHAIDARQAPQQPWLREAGGQRVMRVLVTARTRGADLTEARQDIIKRGGEVVSHSPETSTLVAVLPAAQIRPVAARADILHIAPYRPASSGATAGEAATLVLPGFAPGTTTARGRNDLALLGED